MARKAIKIILIILMIIGISFSISNFISLRLNAAGQLGIWNSDIDECEGFPAVCNWFQRG
jgi:hypothetical protein